MVADKHHFDFLVVLLQEQIQQDKEAFGDVLVHLGHGTGYIHQAEHHRTGGGFGLLQVLPVAQVDLVNERNAFDVGFQPRDFLFQHLDLVFMAEGRIEIIRCAFQRLELFFQVPDLFLARAAQAQTPGVGAPKGTHHIQLGGHALGGEARAYITEGFGVLEFFPGQIGQLQIVEQEVEKLFLGNLEGELIHAFSVRAGLALPLALATAALGFGDGVPGHPFLIAGVHHLAPATVAVVEYGLVNIPGGDAYFLAPFDIGDGALLHGIRHRLLDVVAVTAQEPFPVHCALVLAVQAPVNNVGHTHGTAPAGR